MNGIVRWLKKYFIPHEGNEHRPHFLRRKTVALACLVAVGGELVFLLGTSYVVPRSSLFGIVVVNTLTDETNSQRTTNDLSALQESPLLEAAAQKKADDMVANNYFSHTSPSGKTPWYWFASVGYGFKYAGENLAINYSDSQDVTTAWMNSPEHRANILNHDYTQIGIATAQGELNGKPAVYVVELFGTPAPTTVAVATVAAATPAKAPAVSVVETAAESTQTPASTSPEGTASPVDTEPTFVAVEGAETGTASTAAPATVTATQPAETSNLIQETLADPRRTADNFYLALMGLFALALMSNIFIKIRIQHPDLILGGVTVIAIAAVCIILNHEVIGIGAFIL
ncbi:MAG: CAP domain-containing protein [Candidatus Pacebacteria bacterium]|nr:CAP domain-containing protein [Candidatus Paceibacterota bacterium]